MSPRQPWARRLLARLLPDDVWSREYLAELDHELQRALGAGRVRWPALWWARQLVSPATIRFLWLMRRRAGHHGAAGPTVALRGGPSLLSGAGADVRQAVRSFAREPRLAAVVVLMLGAGVGAVTALHGVSERLFLGGPSHVEAPDELVRFYVEVPDPTGTRTAPYIPYLTARAIQESAPGLAGSSLYRLGSTLGRVGEDVETLALAETDAGYFDVLGVRPAVGRFPGRGADDLAARPAVISSALAAQRFGAPERALGRTLELSGGVRHEIVGVAPEGFSGPHLERVDVWLPMDRQLVGNRNWWMIGRLPVPPDAAALERLAAEADAVHRRTDPGGSFRWALEGRITAAGVRHDDGGQPPAEAQISALLLAMVSLLLALVAANAVNLLAARMARRRDEIAVRLALGIGRARLVRMVVVESVLLALAGGALALPVAHAAGTLLRRELLPQVAWAAPPLGPGAVGWAAGLALLLGLAVGLVPAVQATRTGVGTGAAAAGRQSASRRQVRWQTALVALQLTLSAALLMSAGLFLRSFWTMRVTDLGIAEDALAVRLQSVSESRLGLGSDFDHDVHLRALERVRAVPGLERSAIAVGLPLLYGFGMSVSVPGMDSVPSLPGGGPYYTAVSGGYFDAVGTAVLRGRPITDEDGAANAQVVVVSAAMARTLWPGGESVGACLEVGGSENGCWTVVGVAADTHRQGYREPPSMQLYVPLGHERGTFGGMALVVRPQGMGGGGAERMRQALAGVDLRVERVDVTQLASLLDSQIRPWRMGASVLTLTAALALLVSLLGVYGVLSHFLAQRRHEIGVRLALGASPGTVRRLVWGRGLVAAAVGVAAGVALLLGAARWIEPRLFETSVADPLVITTVVWLLMAGSALACAAPARAAARVDPLGCLRDGEG
jgi:predicted permease